jgi:hypothetical protein
MMSVVADFSATNRALAQVHADPPRSLSEQGLIVPCERIGKFMPPPMGVRCPPCGVSVNASTIWSTGERH